MKRKITIEETRSIEKHADFIHKISSDPLLCDPHYAFDKDNLYGASKREDEHIYAVYDGDEVKGLFVWLISQEERYIEMIVGLVEGKEFFSGMLEYMESNYSGYKLDFVINPQNKVMINMLKEKKAEFEPEQQWMRHIGSLPTVSAECVQLFSDKWEEQYCKLHQTDLYWTADRVLAARDRFRIFLAIKDDQVIGYLDVTYGNEKNEPYDLYVKPEYACQGYEAALIKKAVEMNSPKQMWVLVDVDEKAETELYESVGFEKVSGLNSVYATYSC